MCVGGVLQDNQLKSPLKPIRMTPWKTVLIVMGSTVLAEAIIMLLLDPPFTATGVDMGKLKLALIDALALGIIVSPVVYYFLLLPLRRKTVQALEQRHTLQDELTGLPTRLLFQEIARHEINVAHRNAQPLVLLVVDPARLSEINQIFGYTLGDLVIKEIGSRLQGMFRASDVKARLSGDQFGLLLPSVNRDSIGKVANNIAKALNKPFRINDISINLGTTLGVAIFPDHAGDERTLIQRAMIALSKAKNDLLPYAVFDEEFESSTQDRIKLYSKIRLAIENKAFELCYQPKIDMASGQLAGAEALIRWHNESLQDAPRMIPFAEQFGLIGEITRWVTSEAVRQVEAWRIRGLSIPVSVNISARDLLDVNLVAFLSALCSRHGVNPSSITLEITESAMMVHPEQSISILHQLKARDFRISIDDFGTGYSSMAYLRDVPADELKIDQSFIRTMGDDPRNDALISAMVGLGNKLGLKTVAEGVESEDILRRIQASGCEIVQGYLYSHPLPPDEFIEWVEKRGNQAVRN